MDFLGGFFGQCAKPGDGEGRDSKDRDRDSKDKKSKDGKRRDVNANVTTPVPTKDDQLDFYLYNDSQNPQVYNPLIFNDEQSLKTANFDPAKATKVLLHTRSSGFLSEFPQNAKDAYLTNPLGADYNVICVDWSELAQESILYYDILPRAAVIGQRVGDFLLWLARVTNLNLRRNVHVVGHGVGAHTAGHTGDTIKAAGKILKRISGLDPCSPGFRGRNCERVLSEDDAVFVDVYHTDGTGLGHPTWLGNVDYVVNGGIRQPFCDGDDRESHHAAHRFFAQTIVRGPERTDVTREARVHPRGHNGGYTGRLIFGEYCLPGTRGVYHVSYNMLE